MYPSWSPTAKYDKTDGLAALIGFSTNVTAKSAAYISDYFMSESVFSDEPNATAFNIAYNTSDSLFAWLAQAGNETNHTQFGVAMNGFSRSFQYGLILEHYSWGSLSKGSIVVDVGGGIGSSTLVLARQYPHLKFIVQDLFQTIKDGKKYWESEFPEAISSGQVELQVHDFFTAQSIRNASVFLLQFILHDWSTSNAKKILAQLRSAAQPTTRVVIVEQIIPFLSMEPRLPSMDNIPGAELPDLPYPLVRGAASPIFSIDLGMLNVCNSMERTLGDWVECVKGTGWEVIEVRHDTVSSLILAPEVNGVSERN